MKLGGWSPKTFHHLCLVAACLIGAMRVTDYLDVPTTPAVLSAAAVQQPAPSITPVPLATAAPSPTPSASPTPIPATTSKPAGSTYSYGIAAGSGLSKLDPATLAARLDGIKALGVTWLRFDIEWNNIEAAGRGQFDWSAYDRVAAAAHARGFESLGILDYTPAWARRGDCTDSPMCGPANPADFATFAAAAVARYHAQGVIAWEVWNEPNTANFFRPKADPVAYTSLLKAAYPAIKHADPAATVLTGGTAPASDGGANLSPPTFLAALYQAGAKGSFDGVAHHPYSYPFTPANAYPQGAWGQASAMHGLMAANGDGIKKIWLTEYGAPTNGPDHTAAVGEWPLQGGWQVTEALQAKMVTDAITAYRKFTWAGPLFWYSFQDVGTSPSDKENFFGLLRADGSAKPAYAAFKSAIAKP